MKYTHSVLFMIEICMLLVDGGLAPDIDLKGNVFMNDNSTVLQFLCSTNIAVWQCTVEFLIEERTHDDFRYVKNTCYHKEGICSPDICACSEACESFKWNITVTPEMMSHSYSCGTRMKTEGVTFLANISVKWDVTDGFILFKKTVLLFDIASQHQQSTTFPPEGNADIKMSDHNTMIIILATVGSIVGIFIFIVIFTICVKSYRSKRHKEVFTADQNQQKPQQGRLTELREQNMQKRNNDELEKKDLESQMRKTRRPHFWDDLLKVWTEEDSEIIVRYNNYREEPIQVLTERHDSSSPGSERISRISSSIPFVHKTDESPISFLSEMDELDVMFVN